MTIGVVALTAACVIVFLFSLLLLHLWDNNSERNVKYTTRLVVKETTEQKDQLKLQ